MSVSRVLQREAAVAVMGVKGSNGVTAGTGDWVFSGFSLTDDIATKVITQQGVGAWKTRKTA
ncbi:hypothetical protein GMLC_32630 [Geomonas limicola]|uniref:Uncharacterized protein n=1 Tax=Geomonas limicola TaxID=2740186 RepID=A0A6V8NCS5_9BACT|nr:hypothetical protein GMLC_32630 [Geomonas limicola]